MTDSENSSGRFGRFFTRKRMPVLAETSVKDSIETYPPDRSISDSLVAHIALGDDRYTDATSYRQLSFPPDTVSGLTRRIKYEVETMTRADIHDFTTATCPDLLLAIGDFRLPHRDIPTANFLTHAMTVRGEKLRRPERLIDQTWKDHQERDYLVHSSPADAEVFDLWRLRAAGKFTEHVAINEDLFRPLQYKNFSPVPTDILAFRIRHLFSEARDVPDFALFGTNTQPIYEKLRDRLLPEMRGISPIVFPPELTDQQLESEAIRRAYSHQVSNPLRVTDVVTLPLDDFTYEIRWISPTDGTAKILGLKHPGEETAEKEWITKTVPLRWLFDVSVVKDFAIQLSAERELRRRGR